MKKYVLAHENSDGQADNPAHIELISNVNDLKNLKHYQLYEIREEIIDIKSAHNYNHIGNTSSTLQKTRTERPLDENSDSESKTESEYSSSSESISNIN